MNVRVFTLIFIRGTGESRFRAAAKVASAASKFKKGMRHQKAQVEAIAEEMGEVEEQPVDFSKALQQAEDGILRELHKENRLLWKLDQAGVLEEVNSNFRSHVKKSAALFEFVDFDYSNEEEENKERIMQERYVRCFVSAPYSDMQAERRLLAQEVIFVLLSENSSAFFFFALKRNKICVCASSCFETCQNPKTCI